MIILNEILIQNLMISTILVDDESECLDVLEAELMKNCPDFQIIGKFVDSEKALSIIENIISGVN